MNKAELYMIDTYKCEELKKRLKPITDWNEVKEGTKLFHNTDNDIFNVNIFKEYNKEDNIIWCKNKEGFLYDMSTTGWYYYDESVADEVQELYTPKLYELDGMTTVAFTKEEAFKYLKEKYNHIGFDYKSISDIKHINEIDGFEIVLK